MNAASISVWGRPPSTAGCEQTVTFEWTEGRVVQVAHGTRGHAGSCVIPVAPVKVAGRDQALALTARGIVLPLAESYRNIPTTGD